MQKRIAKFEKVSYEEYRKAINNDEVYVSAAVKYMVDKAYERDTKPFDSASKYMYDSIPLPKRATTGSAGYDFVSPIKIELEPGEGVTIPTGIRCKIDDGWVLKCYPRSGYGFKYKLRLDNTVGIIDSDYYYSDNEGHIMIKVTNCGDRTMVIEAGKGFAQGVFVEYGITVDDEADGIRNGGFGSTSESAAI